MRSLSLKEQAKILGGQAKDPAGCNGAQALAQTLIRENASPDDPRWAQYEKLYYAHC